MKRKLTKKTTAVLLAVLLCLTVSTGVTVAYFNDYEDASGGATISLGGKTELYEGKSTENKDIQIKNTGKTNMIVRVAIFGADEYMNVTFEDEKDWKRIGDFYYYREVLLPEATTSFIYAKVEQEWEGKVRPDYDFDVTVVHESAQAIYDGSKLVTPDGWDNISNVIAPTKLPGKGE